MNGPDSLHLPKSGDRLLGKFRIDRIIGQGGAGVVFAAHHELLDRPIAIKLLLAEAGSETALRFVNEAKLAAKIHSEHVCRVMDVGVLESGMPYIAMEYLEGQDLDAVIEVGAVPVARACDYVIQALEAVAQAHAQGIVHRDLKPSNLFLAKLPSREMPIVKVLDFGISKGEMLGGDTDVTSSRAILGSPSYMSPEQIKNARTVDARTDIWAIGVILYELTTGRRPFPGETVGEVFAKILEGDPTPPRVHSPHLPEAFEAIVIRCLRRDREQRYASVAELADALAPLATESSRELLTSIHDAVSPLLVALAATKLAEALPTRRDLKAETTDPPAPPSASLATAAAAITAPSAGAPAPKPGRWKRRAVLFLVFVAFGLGGASVWFLGQAPNLEANVESLASGAVSAALSSAENTLSAAMASPNDAGAAALTAADPRDAHDDALMDAALDGSLDANDDASADDDDDDDDVDAASASVTGARPPLRPNTTKPGPHKKPKPGKRRLRK